MKAGLKDVRVIASAGFRYDLVLTPAGRIDFVMGADKLIVQCLHAVYNQEVLGTIINIPVEAISGTIFMDRLNALRMNQYLQTHLEDPTVQGFNIYRSKDGFEFELINSIPVKKEIVLKSENEEEYFFDIFMVKGDTEIRISSTVQARATEVPGRRRIFLTPAWVVAERDNEILFRFLTPRFFLADELLQSIDAVDVFQGDDPRGIFIKIKIRSMGKAFPEILLEVQR